MTTHRPQSSGAQRFIKAVTRKVFRGGAVSNRGNAPMGKGHDNDGRPFDIETCCYLKPVFASYDEAIKEGIRTEIVELAGVKTMKSFALESCCADHICNRSGDSGIFFGSGDVADTVSTTRIMADFSGIPYFKEKLKSILDADIGGNSRFNVTNGAVKFPDKTFFLLPANLNTLQQKNLGFAGIQDAFVTAATGVIEEMIARTTQYRNAVVFIESQGGETNFDSDRHYRATNQGELHVLCPCCGKPHIFNWKAWDESNMTRHPEFVPVPPLTIPSLDHAAWIEHNRPLLIGKVAGFQRGDEKLIKRESGDYIESAILTETHFECFHCGSKWHDDGEFGKTRVHLDKTSHYISANPDALPNKIGFNFPQWINRRLTLERKSGWGHMMLAKLQAQKSASEFGNYEPLKIWWQKTAARTWDKDISAKSPERIGATIYDLDPKKKNPGEIVRISETDCQLNLTHLIYQAWAIRENLGPLLLHYEWVKPPAVGMSDESAREHCKKRVRELDTLFGIEPQNSMKDAAHRPDLVREWAAEDAILVPLPDIHGRKAMKWISFGLLIGDDKTSYKWAMPGRAPVMARYKQFEWTNVDIVKDGRRVRIPIHHRLWSNPSIKEIACRWRDGDSAPKIEVHEKFLQDAGKEGFWAQMTSERLLPWKGRPGKFRWDNEGRPNHAWDGFCMLIVRMDELGYLTAFGAPESADE